MSRQPVLKVGQKTSRLMKAGILTLAMILAVVGIAYALTAGNVDGVWGNPASAADLFRWCYAPDNTTGPAGAPTACSSTNSGIQNSPSTVQDENQVRYGNPEGFFDTDGDRSGFGFNGNNNVGTIAADTPFFLGRFTHYNLIINAPDTPFTSIPLNVTLAGLLCDDGSVPTSPGGSTQTFGYTFTLDETPNDPAGNPGGVCPYGNTGGNGCNDKVTVTTVSDTTFDCPEGRRTVHILGFFEGANCHVAYTPPTVNFFITGEDLASPACLWAEISDPTSLAVSLSSLGASTLSPLWLLPVAALGLTVAGVSLRKRRA